ncbi:MAG TPA: ABC transporter ATP-binding protein [Acidimicrobiales bacterium]|nr:ABC transporter ATP-binding protein [Acidimicrobiales bacterium]
MSKYYRIRRAEAASAPLGHVLRRRTGPRLARAKTEELAALEDVSFEVARGEALGIIGRNGAGKSTLLKVLSRITPPSTGRVVLSGRVGSLLEVGTGFHPELTGRENIFLSGAILGMRRREIGHRFDAIVEFAETTRFLETPVKRYSSGMYVRLAFAVAAHLDSEILIVDEVLAVGDAQFQRKCLAAMGEVRRDGRTVLFVSHNMAAIEYLCPRTLYIEGGRVSFDGPTGSALAAYSGAKGRTGAQTAVGVFERVEELGSTLSGYRVKRVRLGSDDGLQDIFRPGSPMHIAVDGDGLTNTDDVEVGFRIRSASGVSVAGVRAVMRAPSPRPKAPAAATGDVTFSIARLPLNPGAYSLDVGLNDRRTDAELDLAEHVATFEVLASDVYESGYRPTDSEGPVFLDFSWFARSGG